MSGSRLTIITAAITAALFAPSRRMRPINSHQPRRSTTSKPPAGERELTHGWYLRGDFRIGISSLQSDYLPNPS